MKKMSIIAFLVSVFIMEFFFSSLVVAQNNSADTSVKPFVTEIGKPFGNIASIKIDSKGGTIKSADGNLEVIVPGNALDSATTISIQSTRNDLNENDEGAYQLEPSGIKFKTPVQLIFHYADANENADLKSIAWQDDKGQWHRLKKIVIDTTQKTVSCLAPHFSRWAKFDQIMLDPSSASVKVNRSLELMVVEFFHDENESHGTDGSGSDLSVMVRKGEGDFFIKDITVNGIENGNGSVGTTIRKKNVVNSQGTNLGSQVQKFIYKAPAAVPDNNPVAVSVQIYSDKQNKKLLLTSNITVIGGKYHFTYIHIDEGDGCFALVDSSSCIVNLDTDNPSITNIINYRPWSDWPNCSKSCKTEWTNKETVKGLVEINGLASSVITPPKKEGGATNVYMTLVPAMGSTASAIEHCKDGDHTIPSRPYPADPKYISFDIIDRDNFMIHFGGKSAVNELVVQGHNEKTMIYIYKVN